MRYMLLIYSTEGGNEDATPEEQQAEMKRWFDYTDALRDADVLISGEPLQPSTTARTVRNRDGKSLTTDGPFAETKEVLGGYYLLDVDAEESALEWAARCPGADYGAIEVRPIMEIEGM